MPIFYSERSPRPSRIQTLTTATAVACNVDIYDIVELTALATACEFTLTGTPVNGQRLTLIIKDSGGPHNLTFTGAWDSQNVTLPANTGAASRKMILEFIYSSTVSKWLYVSYLTETCGAITSSGAITGASLSAGSGIVSGGTFTASVGASIPKRVLTSTGESSVTPTTDYDVVNVVSMAGNAAADFTFNNPTGTPTPWQELQIYMRNTAAKNSGTIKYGTDYLQGSVISPTVYTLIESANKTYHMTFTWDPNAAKWLLKCRSYMVT